MQNIHILYIYIWFKGNLIADPRWSQEINQGSSAISSDPWRVSSPRSCLLNTPHQVQLTKHSMPWLHGVLVCMGSSWKESLTRWMQCQDQYQILALGLSEAMTLFWFRYLGVGGMFLALWACSAWVWEGQWLGFWFCGQHGYHAYQDRLQDILVKSCQ